jgi:hypothetical protein
MSSISGNPNPTSAQHGPCHKKKAACEDEQTQSAADAVQSASVSSDSTPINPDTPISDLLSQYVQVNQDLEAIQAASAAQIKAGLQLAHIPPGLQKKQSGDLPDGNPWKNVLADSENQVASAQGLQDQQQADEKLRQDLLTLILTRLAAILPIESPITAASGSDASASDGADAPASGSASVSDAPASAPASTATSASVSDTSVSDGTVSVVSSANVDPTLGDASA